MPAPRRSRAASAVALVASTGIGLAFFALAVPIGGRITVPFDAAVRAIGARWPEGAGAFALSLVVLGAVGSAAVRSGGGGESSGWRRALAPLRTSRALLAVRLVAVPLAIALWGGWAPPVLAAPEVGGLTWGKLAVSIAVIIPLGAAALQIATGYGVLDLAGAWLRPIMRPVFRVPGQGALDGLMSWIGSYSVGLYLTRSQLLAGRYTRREAFVVVTGFSTVSVGFVGVVAATLDLLPLFPLIIATWFVASYGLAAIGARTWPATAIPDDTVGAADPEPTPGAALALSAALDRAACADPPHLLVARGLRDGLVLAASLLGTVLVVGTAAVLVAEHTPVLDVLGAPLAPILAALGLPDADRIAPAVLAGAAEVYVPALLVRDAAVEARFFVATLSVSQLIFFSSVGPMMIDMFREIPVRVGHLVALFGIRTAILVPCLAAWTKLLAAFGAFGGL